MNNSLWFDESVYLKNKAGQCGLSEADTLNAVHNAGMDLCTHYACLREPVNAGYHVP